MAEQTRIREQRLGFEHVHLYSKALKGFSAELSKSDVSALREDRKVAYVKADRRIEPFNIPIGKAPLEPLPPTGIRRQRAATPTWWARPPT